MNWNEMSPRERDALCELCGAPRPASNRRWCSKACRIEATTLPFTCEQCGVEGRARRSHVERGQYRYCSPTCAQIASRKYEPVDFNGTRFYKNVEGYFETPGGLKLHRAVWEHHNGAIPDGCVIHHVDGDPGNNDIANLECMAWGEHTSHHKRTGVTLGSFECEGCGRTVERRASDIRRGQNKFCSRRCSNIHRKRNEDGTYAALRAKGVDV